MWFRIGLVFLLLCSFLVTALEEESGNGSGDAESGEVESGNESGDSEESGDSGEISRRSTIAFDKEGPNFMQRSMNIQPTNVETAKRSDSMGYADIIDATLEVILSEGNNSNALRALLMKHYFTDQKSLSIWPKAITETEETLGLEFEERELFEMENDVKNIYRRFLECELHGKKKKNRKNKKITARCFLSLTEYIDDGFVDYALPRGTIEGQARVLQMHVAYQFMSLVALRFAERKAREAGVKYIRAASAALNISSNLVNQTKIVTKNTIDARLQAISQIEVCLMQEVLWQEFEASCEFYIRKKRSLVEGAGIGGEKDIFKRRYRAKVIDYVTKKEICNKAMTTTDSLSDDQVKEKLIKNCSTDRDRYARKVSAQIKAFYTKRTVPIAQKLCRLWSCDDQKLAALKKKIASNYEL